MYNRPGRGVVYVVADRELFVEVLTQGVQERFGGSLRAGVEATNRQVDAGHQVTGPKGRSLSWLPRPVQVNYITAWRALQGWPAVREATPRLKGGTFAWFALFVGADGYGRLQDAVVSPLAQWLFGKQEAWVHGVVDRLARYQGGSVLQAALTAGGGRSGQIEHLLAEMWKANEAEFRRFRKFTRFHDGERKKLALHQLVAPFLDPGSLEGLERRWEELSQADRKQYVYLTLRREALLLDRSPDMQRAQELAMNLRANLSSWAKLGVPPLG
jgi:hypothetical protein